MSRVEVRDLWLLVGREGVLTVGDVRVPVIVAQVDDLVGAAAPSIDLRTTGEPTRVKDEGDVK